MSDLPIRGASQVKSTISDKSPKKRTFKWLRGFFSQGYDKRVVHALHEERDFVNLSVSAPKGTKGTRDTKDTKDSGDTKEKSGKSKRSSLSTTLSQGVSKVFKTLFPGVSRRIAPYKEETLREETSTESSSYETASDTGVSSVAGDRESLSGRGSPHSVEGSTTKENSFVRDAGSGRKEFVPYEGMAFLGSSKLQANSSLSPEVISTESVVAELDFHFKFEDYEKLTPQQKKKAKILTVYVSKSFSQKEEDSFKKKIEKEKEHLRLPQECIVNFERKEPEEL